MNFEHSEVYNMVNSYYDTINEFKYDFYKAKIEEREDKNMVYDLENFNNDLNKEFKKYILNSE